jgi:hypothetical protein
MGAYGSVLLVFKVLPDRKDILSRATQITRQDIFVRVWQQVRELLNLTWELGACEGFGFGLFGCRTSGPAEKGRPLEGVAPATHGWRRRGGLGFRGWRRR